jgi:hypothetical protein
MGSGSSYATKVNDDDEIQKFYGFKPRHLDYIVHWFLLLIALGASFSFCSSGNIGVSKRERR